MIYIRWGVKRSLDIFLGMLGLFFFGVFIIFGGLLVFLTSRGPVFFLQKRVGQGGRHFEIYKLRTMQIDPQRRAGQTYNADPDVLPVGRILRRLKIDEMPQIFNVLLGDMSLVGPRPCLPQTADEMPDWARQRFDLRPGITGLAQINGNIALTWEERWQHDVYYVQHCSLLMDIGIILRTVFVILSGEERYRKVRK